MTHKIALLALLLLACDSEKNPPLDGAVALTDAGIDAPSRPDTGASADSRVADTGLPDGALRCPDYSPPAPEGKVATTEITELSGLVSSSLNPGVLWTHNDSGDTARVFALSETGVLLLEVNLIDVSATDIEDLALGVALDGTPTLYLADIGDNAERRERVRVYAVEEPLLSALSDTRISLPAQTLQLTYADRPHNAETLLFDPIDSQLWIVTKGLQATLYRITLSEPSQILTPISTLEFPIATGGSISPDGRAVLLRGYSAARLWLRARGVSVDEALAGEECRVPLASEEQGEAITFAADNLGYWTASEGVGSVLYFYGRTDTE